MLNIIDMPGKLRVRFAPSPTGPLHIGGVRTALFNYLFAKKHEGEFILRIEDTDQNRLVEGSEAYIIDSLNWCGIPFDEGPSGKGNFGPYRQSERKHLYKEYAQRLINNGRAYYAFDTPEELDQLRSEYEAGGKTFIYNWSTRDNLKNSLSLSDEEVANLLQSNHPYVIRYKMPKDCIMKLSDLIRGKIEINTSTLDDKILFKSDGMPTYHLANVVDDHLMEISHVIRGEEWLPSLALHYQLYESLGWSPPEFAHLPLILKPVGKGKLSKRDGEKMGFPVFPLSWESSQGYREAGYYPEAVINFLALLGWNPGDDREIFTLEELIGEFSLDRVQKSGARFDPEKTKWYNHYYLQQQSVQQLAGDIRDQVEFDFSDYSDAYLEKVVLLLKERADFVKDIWNEGSYFFIRPDEYNEKVVKKQWKQDTPTYLMQLQLLYRELTDFSSAFVEEKTKDWIQSQELGFGKVLAPLRLVMVGDLKGPHLFDIMELLGREECLERISNALEQL